MLNIGLDPDKATQRIMLDCADEDKEYEPEIGDFMRRFLAPGDNFIDVGAHIGYFTILAAELVAGGKVYAFEPEFHNYTDLVENVEMNGYLNVRLFNNAVGDKEKPVKLFINADNDGGHALWNPANHPFNVLTKEQGPQSQDVGMVRLDDVIDFDPKAIKIDVEGCELMVLKGAEEILKKYKPAVILEINFSSLAEMGTNTEEVQRYMEDLGYKVFMLETGIELKVIPPKSRNIFNIVFVKVNHVILPEDNPKGE